MAKKNKHQKRLNDLDGTTDLDHWIAQRKGRLERANKLDEMLLRRLAQPGDSLEPLGPLAGPSTDISSN
jgi:hypothetical protein